MGLPKGTGMPLIKRVLVTGEDGRQRWEEPEQPDGEAPARGDGGFGKGAARERPFVQMPPRSD